MMVKKGHGLLAESVATTMTVALTERSRIQSTPKDIAGRSLFGTPRGRPA